MSKTTFGPKTWLFPMPSVLVGTMIDGKPNFMTAAWCQVGSGEPPTIVVAIRPVRHTTQGIEEHKQFSINVPSTSMAKEVDYAGIYTGKKWDKSELFKVCSGKLENAPLAEDCPVNLECNLIHTLVLGSHTLMVGEIVETHVSDNCIKDGKLDISAIDPLVFVPGTSEYYGLGDVVGKAFSMGKEKD